MQLLRRQHLLGVLSSYTDNRGTAACHCLRRGDRDSPAGCSFCFEVGRWGQEGMGGWGRRVFHVTIIGTCGFAKTGEGALRLFDGGQEA